MEIRPAELLIGDVTPHGIVACVVCKSHNLIAKVTFEDGTVKLFKGFEKITVLEP